jgi:hypothetical protein
MREWKPRSKREQDRERERERERGRERKRNLNIGVQRVEEPRQALELFVDRGSVAVFGSRDTGKHQS